MNTQDLLDKIDSLELKIAELEKSKYESNIWIENSPVCTKIVDKDFNLLYMSSAGVLGLKIDDIEKHYGTQYPLSFYADSFKLPMAFDLKNSKETGKTYNHEAAIKDSEGKT